MTYEDCIKMGYHRVLVADEDAWLAQVLEFEGCMAIGDTESDALNNLKDAIESWVEAVTEMGQTVPPPFETVHEWRRVPA
jgi:predicted RNase H-like HicB family nuclease